MSSYSALEDCPRCGAKQSLVVESETRPFEQVNATCLNCGFNYYTKMVILNNVELEEVRDNMQDYLDVPFVEKTFYEKEVKAFDEFAEQMSP